MFSFLFARILLGLYALLLGVGGYVGYKKAGSKPSLYAGVGSAALCLLALLFSFLHAERGLQAGAAVALALTIFFNFRFVAGTRKLMPAGMLAIISLLVFTGLLLSVI
ncbi:TMEM14 family protein [Paludisphaera mucosa]|uniref:TMEM14 family protein n=1 Tax=Paludisphaera mucosa TaxID=3030827 RepID=A0ABT6FHE6_9BACT|nr:TMEM14 family protein [Paludisphaera mucosa]MDG3006808.1 TMEM14 family protein [Paludisphaera mucosa]